MLYDLGAKGGTVYVDGSRSAQVLSLSDDENNDQQQEFEDVVLVDAKISSDERDEDVSFRANRQDREIGMNSGDLCPLCLEGTVIISGGCSTCSNCNAQLKCGL